MCGAGVASTDQGRTMTDSTSTSGSDVPEDRPVTWEQSAAPAMSPLETLDGATPLDVLPAAAPRSPRSKRPWIVGIAVAAVLVLVMGGVAAALLLNRPDVKLQRALSAMTDSPTGSVTMSVRMPDAGDPTMQKIFDKGAVRVAWDKASDTQQWVLLMNGEDALDLVVAPESVIVAQNLAALGIPEAQEALDSLVEMGTQMGPDADAFVKFAQGSPLRIQTGPDSAYGKLMKETESLAGAQPRPDDAKVQELADKLQQAVRDNVEVTDEGSDQYGDHLRATIPVKPVLAAMLPAIEEVVGQAAPTDALDEIPGDPKLVLDVWVRDGTVVRAEVPLGELARQLGEDASTNDMTIVLEMSEQGVTPPAGEVVDLPDSLFDGLGAGLLGGGLGGLDGGTGVGIDSGFALDDSGL